MVRPHVLIRLNREWSPVGHARIVRDECSGMRMLRLDLSATAPTLYLALDEVGLLLDTLVAPLEGMPGIAVGQA